MVKINKIYTRSGDEGMTGLVGGDRIKKNSLRVKSYGELDELNSYLGWARTIAEKDSNSDIAPQLSLIQNEIFDLGAYLASPEGSDKVKLAISENEINRLEKWIDAATESLEELKSFVLPGGSELNSVLHVGRTVCRRCERSILDLMDSEKVDPMVLIYINRLSDYLFALARKSSALKNTPEYLWKPGDK